MPRLVVYAESEGSNVEVPGTMASGLPESLEELHHVMPRPAVEFASQSPIQGNLVEAIHSVRTHV